jgi:hypothetical protein
MIDKIDCANCKNICSDGEHYHTYKEETVCCPCLQILLSQTCIIK